MTPKAEEHKPRDIIREIYRRVELEEPKYDALHRNVPLSIASQLERPYRRLFLDHEELAAEANSFFMRYATRNPQILTSNAKTALEYLATAREFRIYVTEIDVPELPENQGKHVTDIDLVSFYNMQETMRILESIVRVPANLFHFSAPHQKGNIRSRYWVAHSVTRNGTNEKVEITDIKLRKRIHGSGFKGLNSEQIRRMHELGVSHIIGTFAD